MSEKTQRKIPESGFQGEVFFAGDSRPRWIGCTVLASSKEALVIRFADEEVLTYEADEFSLMEFRNLEGEPCT
jgi:hypothetical protein